MSYKEKIKADDFILNKLTNELYFVVVAAETKLLVRKESTKNDLKITLEERTEIIDNGFFNKYMFKVDPDMARLLYDKMQEEVKKNEQSAK